MAFFNTGCRYLFSMGREGALPAILGRTHPVHHSTHIAGIASAIFVGVWVLAFYLYDPTVLAALTKLGTWSPLLGVAGILSIQALVSVAILLYFLNTAKDGFHWFKTLVCPILAAVTQAFTVYLLFASRETLSGAGDVPFIIYLWVWPLAVFLLGIVIALILRATRPDRFQRIGRYLHEDVAAA